MKKLFFALLLTTSVMVSPSVGQLVVVGDTTGTDNFTTSDFYGVALSGGSGFVESVSWDLSVDGDAFFDFDGSGSFMDGTDAILDFGSLMGIDASDITFVWTDIENHPTLLTAEFAPGSFSAGDSFRFGADTDFLTDPAPGSAFGDSGVIFNVNFASGESVSGVFQTVGADQSIVTLTSSAIPEPSAAMIIVLAMCLPVIRRR